MELSPLRYLDNDMAIMLCEQVVLSRKRKLFKVFEYVFTRSKDPTDLNPRLGGHDLSISSKCFVAIMDHLMIDFWRCNCIYPSWSIETYPDDGPSAAAGNPEWEVGDRIERSNGRCFKEYKKAIDHYGGNPTVDKMIIPVKPYDQNNDFGMFANKWSVLTMFEPSTWSYICQEKMVHYMNYVHDTEHTLEEIEQDEAEDEYGDDDDDDDDDDKFWEPYDTIDYFYLIEYVNTWIDRWAHEFVEDSKIPEKERTYAVVRDGITDYDFFGSLHLRDKETLFRGDFDIDTIPESLKTCWELFLMCENSLIHIQSDK